jgi:RNA polymerase sigma-70 factor (ECF subfamily)
VIVHDQDPAHVFRSRVAQEVDPEFDHRAKMGREMPLLTEDRDLLDAFRAGGADALERVYRHYAPKLAQFLRRGFTFSSKGETMSRAGLATPFELDGALQEVFARAFQPRARLAYDGVRPYIDFLVGIGKHVLLDEVRRRNAREIPSELDADSLQMADEAPSPEETIEERRARELVARFLADECDDKDRRLFELRFHDDLAQEGAAKEAGLTRIQVRRWETKFRARLLRFLKRARYVP